jgi:HSP20 family protein
MAQDVTTTRRRQPAQRGDGEVARAEPTRARSVWLPRTDVWETGEEFVIMAELPGIAPDQVNVTLENRVLTIRGRAADREHPGYRQVYGEYEEGDFERAFTLSQEIDQEHIEAQHIDGVLKLRLPKAAEARERRIQIRTA